MTTALTNCEPATYSTRVSRTAPGRNRRVLHVINGEHYSGAERVQDLLALALPAEGFDVGFACVKPGLFPRVRRATQAPIYSLSMRTRFDLRVAVRLARLIEREGYELVHAHTPRSVLVGRVAAALAKVPLVYHVHSPTARDSTRPIRNWLNHCSERLSLSGARALIPVSGSLARHMVGSGYAEAIIHTVPNGVPSPPTHRSAVAPNDVWTLGMVALFRPRKGLETLLDALAILQGRTSGIRVRAIGPFEKTGEYELDIQRRVRALGLERSIEWIGFTENVNDELVRLDALILPSLFGEGLPMVILEAMAAGVPVIATKVEGVPEAIEHGVNGLLAEPGNANDLARCIEQLVGQHFDWLELRQNALQTHADRFSDRIMAARVASVYRQMLA